MLTHRLPFPPNKGDRIRSYHWLKTLASCHEVDLVSLADAPVCDSHLEELKKLTSWMHVVNISPENRNMRFAKAFFKGQSLTEAYFSSPAMTRVLSSRLKHRSYHVGLAVCSSAGAYFLKTHMHGRLIVDMVDVDSHKWSMYSRYHHFPEKWIYARESKTVASLEKRLADLADLCITVSPRETRCLKQIAPDVEAISIPNGVDISYFGSVESTAPTDRLVFVGQMDYFPNVEAVKWFAHNVWQKLQQRLPHLQWDIVGRNPTSEVKALTAFKNVTVTGEVDDIRPWLRSAIAIAPIKLSFGIQNKVLEAMAAGRPVVASPAVAEGFDDNIRQAILTAETPEKWITTLETLLMNRSWANQLGKDAGKRIAQYMNWDQISNIMKLCISDERFTGASDRILMDDPSIIC
jgi:sugar transferase (PEP-CTERM/EpsH1 system associated)